MNYAGVIYDSRLDVFKNDGVIRTASVTVSGSLAGSEMKHFSSSSTSLASPDFAVIAFDNSAKHSGSYKSMALQGGSTLIRETTNNSDLAGLIRVIISGSTISYRVTLMNPYSSAVNLQTTTVNFEYIAYGYTT